MKKFLFTVVTVVLIAGGDISAQEPSASPSEAPPQKISIEKMPAQIIDTVIVPVPSEVFSVLDKLGSPNWHEVLRTTQGTGRGERAQIALQLGAVIGEGFIAVEAQESEEVKKIGKNVLKLSSAINVQKSVQPRTTAIIDAADKKDWKTVKAEFDKALQEVKQAMIELGDEQLAQLVSLGGWLRGTEALTQVVTKTYTKDGAELLRQPALLDYFERRLDGMNPRLKRNAIVQVIEKRLPEIRPLITTHSGEIPRESVERIHEITADLVKSISSREP